MIAPDTHVAFIDVTVRFAGATALGEVSLAIPRHRITTLIGPARSGKSTVLRCINRMVDTVRGCRVSGSVLVDGLDVLRIANVHELRRRVGMVLPLPVGLPLSVYDNVALGPRLAGVRSRQDLDARVEQSLRQAALWDEVKDRLRHLGTTLSGGQQQRLALARALSQPPDILCLDEFSIAVDPVTTMTIEEVLQDLKTRMTIVIATNLVQQAHRLADQVVFLNAGAVVEAGTTEAMFSEHPASGLTFAYLRGQFG